MLRILIAVLFFSLTLSANDADDIIKKVDENMRGNNVHMKLSMSISAMGHKRTMKMESWAEGSKKNFVKITYPPKDKGMTFLSLNNQMWQYVPKIERIIKIPSSMMLQNWMGSDITNDDMVKQSSIVDDYDAKLLSKEGTIAMIQLTPKEDAAVVWGKIISTIDTSTYTNKQDVFYDEEGIEVRVFTYQKVKQFGKYYTPTYWKVMPSDKKGHQTEIMIEDVVYDSDISSQYFQKSALKRFSR